jgi:hypothetical protein
VVKGAVILGMSRSGTSAVASTFAAAGFFVGVDGEVMGPTAANPDGHWENLRLFETHEAILKRLDGTWLDPPASAAQLVGADWAVPEIREQLERLFEQAQGAPVVVKDPRIGVLLSFWHQSIEDNLVPVLVIRNPLDVAASLRSRDGTPSALGLGAWELHLTLLLEGLDGRQVVAAPYAQLLERPALASELVSAVREQLDPECSQRVRPEHARLAVAARHRNQRGGEDRAASSLTTRQLELWRWLEQLPAGAQTLSVPDELKGPSDESRVAAAQERERATMAAELRDLKIHRERLEGMLRQAQDYGDRLTDRLAHVEAGVVVMERERDEARHREQEHKAARLRAEQVYRNLLSSPSWRVTRPLREVKALVERRADGKRRG